MSRTGAGPDALRLHLRALASLRGAGCTPPPCLAQVKAWQSRRLETTYADLASQPRYRAATRFFLDDLYGPKDFSARDEELLRIVPVMARVLPGSAMETAALAIELEALSEALDQALARALADGNLTQESYARAYRESSSREERLHQIDLVEAVGTRLDALVARPFVGATLRVMRAPAHLAGLGDLQDFLESGFAAFRTLHGSAEFLAAFRSRETAILNRLFSGFSQAPAG